MKATTSSSQGSALLVAMIFSIALAMITASYVTVSLYSLKTSHRAYHSTAAANIAELGVEEGMWSLWTLVDEQKKKINDPYTIAFPAANWKLTGTDYIGTFQNIALGSTASSQAKVYVKVTAAEALIASRAVVTLASDNMPVEKWIEVKLGRSSTWANAVTSMLKFNTNGSNATFDSWDSTSDSSLPYLPYTTAKSRDLALSASAGKTVNKWVHDRCPIATVSISGETAVDNAKIYGSASVGSSTEASINVGSQGSLGPFGTPTGDIADGYVSTDFKADLPVKNFNPDDPLYNTKGTNATTGMAYDYTIANPKTYSTIDPSVPLSNKVYFVKTALEFTDTPLIVPENTTAIIVIEVSEGQSAIKLTKDSGIKVKDGGTLKIYTAGDIAISGQGLINETSSGGLAFAGKVQIYGTSTGTTNQGQSIDITGNGSLSAIVYAPTATVKVSGGGGTGSYDVCGAFVAKTFTISGNSSLHYDEALAKMEGDTPYAIKQWRELVTSDERATYSAKLSL
jgi:hypothetical protein